LPFDFRIFNRSAGLTELELKLVPKLDDSELVMLVMVVVTVNIGAVTALGRNEEVSEELTGGGGGNVVGVEPSLLFMSIICMLAECGCIVIISMRLRDGRTPIR